MNSMYLDEIHLLFSPILLLLNTSSSKLHFFFPLVQLALPVCAWVKGHHWSVGNLLGTNHWRKLTLPPFLSSHHLPILLLRWGWGLCGSKHSCSGFRNEMILHCPENKCFAAVLWRLLVVSIFPSPLPQCSPTPWRGERIDRDVQLGLSTYIHIFSELWPAVSLCVEPPGTVGWCLVKGGRCTNRWV